jgi:hypothetical protein
MHPYGLRSLLTKVLAHRAAAIADLLDGALKLSP